MIKPIPAIDLIGGQCVRLTKGDYNSKTIYSDNPLEMAVSFENAGFSRIHLVDLDGAKSKHVVNIDVLRSISNHTNLEIDFGGGIKSETDLKAVFDSGARWATIGSLAVTQPSVMQQWIDQFGASRFILGADIKDGVISINGWKENSNILLFDFLDSYIERGITNILCTDISKDGMLNGTSVELYKSIMKRYPNCQLIASGGVSCIEDISELNDAGIPAVVFGKAIYEGRISLNDVCHTFINKKTL